LIVDLFKITITAVIGLAGDLYSEEIRTAFTNFQKKIFEELPSTLYEDIAKIFYCIYYGVPTEAALAIGLIYPLIAYQLASEMEYNWLNPPFNKGDPITFRDDFLRNKDATGWKVTLFWCFHKVGNVYKDKIGDHYKHDIGSAKPIPSWPSQ
jgi:hypothetical protein